MIVDMSDDSRSQKKHIVDRLLTELRPSECYGVQARAHGLLTRFLEKYLSDTDNGKVLLFGRTRPGKILKELERTKEDAEPRIEIFWLSTALSKEERTIAPTELPKINRSIMEFTEGGEGIVVIEGIEYLRIHNGFEQTIKLIQNLRDMVALSKTSLVIFFDMLAFTESEGHMLAREFNLVK